MIMAVDIFSYVRQLKESCCFHIQEASNEADSTHMDQATAFCYQLV